MRLFWVGEFCFLLKCPNVIAILNSVITRKFKSHNHLSRRLKWVVLFWSKVKSPSSLMSESSFSHFRFLRYRTIEPISTKFCRKYPCIKCDSCFLWIENYGETEYTFLNTWISSENSYVTKKGLPNNTSNKWIDYKTLVCTYKKYTQTCIPG